MILLSRYFARKSHTGFLNMQFHRKLSLSLAEQTVLTAADLIGQNAPEGESEFRFAV